MHIWGKSMVQNNPLAMSLCSPSEVQAFSVGGPVSKLWGVERFILLSLAIFDPLLLIDTDGGGFWYKFLSQPSTSI